MLAQPGLGMESTPRSTSSTSNAGTIGAEEGGVPTSQEPSPQLLDVARIVKPHGIRGELVVDLWTNRNERLEPGTVLATGDGRTVSVVAARPHQGRFLVRLDGINTREEAERLRGSVLRASPVDDQGELWVHELVGANVMTTNGIDVGTVGAVEANPASDLLVLEDGTLVPLTFAVEMVRGPGRDRRVIVDVPPGLLE